MKLAIITNALQEEKLIFGCVAQFKHYELDHLVLIPYKSWNGDYESQNDKTGEIALDAGALVAYGDWKTEAEQLNYGLWYFSDYDWIIICDADERYTRDGFSVLYRELSLLYGFDSLRTNKWHVYWKTMDYELMPPQTDFPLIAVRPFVKFLNKRSCNCVNTAWTSVPMYHASYVRSNEEMLRKISSFSHSSEININEWYNNVWLKWTPDMENLHPVQSEQFKSAVFSPAPDEIKKKLLNPNFSG
jgi:glycosyltransferase involved in cell wall biosynthesis